MSRLNIARLLVQDRRFEAAKALFGPLRESLEIKTPERTEELEGLILATAATKGWPAAAAICKGNIERFPDSPWMWLNKAWIFRFVGDEEEYRQVVTKVLALGPSITSTNDQHVPVEIAALGPFSFSTEQVNQLDSLVQALEATLPERSTDEQWMGYRAIGHLHLRLGRLRESLAALEKSASKRTGLDPYLLLIQAECLRRLDEHDKARAAFEQAKS